MPLKRINYVIIKLFLTKWKYIYNDKIDTLINVIMDNYCKYEDDFYITCNIERIPDLTRSTDTFTLQITLRISRLYLMKMVVIHEYRLFIYDEVKLRFCIVYTKKVPDIFNIDNFRICTVSFKQLNISNFWFYYVWCLQKKWTWFPCVFAQPHRYRDML